MILKALIFNFPKSIYVYKNKILNLKMYRKVKIVPYVMLYTSSSSFRPFLECIRKIKF